MDNMIKAIFSASPTNMTMAQALQWDYNPSLISIPVFFVSSMGNGDENLVVSGTQLQEIFDAVPVCIFCHDAHVGRPFPCSGSHVLLLAQKGKALGACACGNAGGIDEKCRRAAGSSVFDGAGGKML